MREHSMLIAANNDMSAIAHQIVELCEWRGERAYLGRIRQTTLMMKNTRVRACSLYRIRQLAATYVNFVYFVRIKMFDIYIYI